MVPKDRPSSYHGRPVVKSPAWTWEIPWYLFAGGLAGGSSMLGFSASVSGNRPLARRAWLVSLAAISASPALLVSDLGRPERFLNMLRVFKLTSPMSVGSWILSLNGAAIVPAAYGALRSDSPLAARAAEPLAAALGLPLATYTGVLLANSVIPVWSEARRELPFLFAASAAASAGAAGVALTPAESSAPPAASRSPAPSVRSWRSGRWNGASEGWPNRTVRVSRACSVAPRRRSPPLVRRCLRPVGAGAVEPWPAPG